MLGLAKTIFNLIEHNKWDKVFSINELPYHDATLEVLSTIELARPSTVTFQVFGEMHTISDTQLVCYLELYDEGFVNTPAFPHLPTNFLATMMHTQFGISSQAGAQMSLGRSIDFIIPLIDMFMHS